MGVGSGDGPGANGIQVRWLQRFLSSAQPRFRTPGLLESAPAEAVDEVSDEKSKELLSVLVPLYKDNFEECLAEP